MDRIPFYNLLNMLFVGLMALMCTTLIVPYDMWAYWHILQGLVNNATIELMLFVSFAYTVGLLVNRMGAWLIEGALKTETGYDDLPCWAKVLKFPWRKYELYVRAQRQDGALKFLTREYVLSRNMMMLSMIMVVASFVAGKYVCGCGFVAGTVLFNVSMRKYVGKIVKRIDVCSGTEE